jgi:predicted O-methyltransferase YrrM
MLVDQVRAVLARLEAEDADERARGVPAAQRSRQVAPTTGRFLFALAASRQGCRVLEIGGSRGYSTIWIAAGARLAGGSVRSLEADPAKWQAWRRNLADAGLDAWAELVEGDAFEALPAPADIVFLDAEKGDYERLFALARGPLEPGAMIVADNVLSHADPLAVEHKRQDHDDGRHRGLDQRAVERGGGVHRRVEQHVEARDPEHRESQQGFPPAGERGPVGREVPGREGQDHQRGRKPTPERKCGGRDHVRHAAREHDVGRPAQRCQAEHEVGDDPGRSAPGRRRHLSSIGRLV